MSVSCRQIHRPLVLASAGGLLVLSLLTQVMAPGHARAATASQGMAATASQAAGTPAPRIFAYYYLWWSSQHWKDKLGSSYPYAASPLPLPATTDADGCNPVSRYSGNQLADVPTTLESQDTPGVIEKDVRQAAAAKLVGFVVNWIGTGSASQTPDSVTYSRRLAALMTAVHKVNSEGIPFTVIFSLKSSATIVSSTYLTNDINYLVRTYGADSAVDHSYSGSRIPIIWTGSRKYSDATLASVSRAVRSRAMLLGDETASSWKPSRAASLDGDHYYWSSQDPYRNPQSFSQLRTLASMVRGSGPNPDGSRKVWLAPLDPGYSSHLLNGSSTCVPRRGGQTLIDLYKGNSTTFPDAYTLISWNEISEGSYIKPMQRYGTLFTDTVSRIVSGTV